MSEARREPPCRAGAPATPARRQACGSLATTAALAATGLWLLRPAVAADRMPEISLRASDGQPVLADGAPGRATYIDFWASWCAPCKLSFPWMNEMHEALSGAGLRIVAVNLDRREADAQRFLQQTPARFAVAMDPAADTARLLAIPTMPTSMLVAPDRRVLFTHRGFRLEDRADLERRLRGALG